MAIESGSKPAPAKMHHFIADLLMDLSVRGKVVSVTLMLAGHGLSDLLGEAPAVS